MTSLPTMDRDPFDYYERLAKVKRYLEANLTEPFPVSKAASVACLSQKYFSAFFRKKTGLRFRAWVNSVRIDHACRLICTRNYSLTDVAFTVGFQDVRTFERAFKKQIGMTPRDYKGAVCPRVRIKTVGSSTMIQPLDKD